MLDVKVGTQNRMYLHSAQNTMAFLRARVLQREVRGFEVGKESLLKVRYLSQHKTVYHRYEGGEIWMATVPEELAKPGQRFEIDVRMLTKSEFVGRIPEFNLVNEAEFSWLPYLVNISNFSSDSGFQFHLSQEPAVEGIERFRVRGIASNSLDFIPGYGCCLQFKVVDFFGRAETLRVYHDGHSVPWLGLGRSKKFPKISFISHDGTRLKLVYNSPQKRVATIYSDDPSRLFRVGPQGGVSEHVNRDTLLCDCYKIELRRNYERKMLENPYRYPHGRLGAEIAYAISKLKIGIKDLILNDPSDGGPDLVTRDGRVVIEARLLVITEAMGNKARVSQIEFQLARLGSRLKSDLAFYPLAQSGYGFLSYLEKGRIRTLNFHIEKGGSPARIRT
jgi:hypothetical protein